METQTCHKCREEKSLSEFPTAMGKNGIVYARHICKACKSLAHAEWRNNNREYVRVSSKEKMQRWRENLSPERFSAYRQNATKRATETFRKHKEAVYAAYGGYVCACCGETEPLFLSVDHINNDGYAARKRGEHGSGGRVYYWLCKQYKETGSWPEGFQILCMNCQHGKARNNGICPHREGVTTIS